MMTFDPEQNRIPTGLLTDEELAALEGAKHGWETFMNNHWVNCSSPSWHFDNTYRAKPAPAPTIIVNGIEVPEPVREALEIGQRYWFASVTAVHLIVGVTWVGGDCDTRVLNRGLIHLTEEAAVAHAKAMLAPSMRGDV